MEKRYDKDKRSKKPQIEIQLHILNLSTFIPLERLLIQAIILSGTKDTVDLGSVALTSCRDEYIDSSIYRWLSGMPFIPSHAKGILAEMASHEERHYRFWSAIAGGCVVRLAWVRILVAVIMTALFGATVAIKILERNENKTIERYRMVVHMLSSPEREELERIISDEISHENMLIDSIRESRIAYLGFIVLGLSDAIIEIAGIHAGTLGVYENAVMAGIAGLIAGTAASMAMAAAAYAQAKQGNMGRPGTSAMYTGIAYFLTAVILAIPYFIVHEILLAFALSIALSIVILAYISTYSSVLYGRNYFREIVETTILVLGASAALYMVGTLVAGLFGIRI